MLSCSSTNTCIYKTRDFQTAYFFSVVNLFPAISQQTNTCTIVHSYCCITSFEVIYQLLQNSTKNVVSFGKLKYEVTKWRISLFVVTFYALNQLAYNMVCTYQLNCMVVCNYQLACMMVYIYQRTCMMVRVCTKW